MPKAPPSNVSKRKAKLAASSSASSSHHPATLDAQLHDDLAVQRFGLVSQPGRRTKRRRREDGDEVDGDDLNSDAAGGAPSATLQVTGSRAGGGGRVGSGRIDAKMSQKILQLAREQMDEVQREEDAEVAARSGSGKRNALRQSQAVMPDDDDDNDDDHEVRKGAQGNGARRGEEEDGELRSDEEYEPPEEYEELEIDPADRELLDRFARQGDGGDPFDVGADEGNAAPRGNRSLADMIMAKIQEAEKGGGDEASKTGGDAVKVQSSHAEFVPPGVNDKVIEVYTKVGDLLSRYKSGPLPKAFKIIPGLPSWETILYLTDPSRWTPHATLAATRIFVSNLKAEQSQRFFKHVLLDRVRDEIRETGKLSVHHYEALKKALFKPAAFFKGFLFPLCDTGCTLKEAAIVSSVLAKVSIPVLHSAAALLRLAEMPYRGPTSLFVRVLLDKKYALPYKVVDALVFHFLRFADEASGVERDVGTGERRMPVLWHQSLLVFCQRYKQDLTPDQKAALLDLLRVQRHEAIGAEVRRELTTGKARGEMLDEPIGSDDDGAMSF